MSAAGKGLPPADFNDSPEWSEEDFAVAKPASEAMPAVIAAALVKNKGGRPKGSKKTMVSLRVDNDTLAAFRSTGDGWQSRMNEKLRETPAGGRIAAAAMAQGPGARHLVIAG